MGQAPSELADEPLAEVNVDTPRKKQLDRPTLEEHGIFYLEHVLDDRNSFVAHSLRTSPKANLDVQRRIHHYLTGEPIAESYHASWPVPITVRGLHELLLDRKQLLPTYTKALAGRELQDVPDAAWYEDTDHNHLRPADREHAEEKWRAFLWEMRQITREAETLKQEKRREYPWQDFMHNHIFRQYKNGVVTPLERSSTDPIFDQYEVCSNVRWNDDTVKRPAPARAKADLPDPQPDFGIGFPMKPGNVKSAEGFHRLAPLRNFTVSKMAHLTRRGVAATPTAELAKAYAANYSVPYYERTDLDGLPKEDLLAFPFGVVELKHGEVGASKEEYCFCQAANGASKALTMLEKLFSIEDGHPDGHRVPPVVAFTGIGPEVRVWIAYSVRQEGRPSAHIMNCIMKLDVTSLWSLLELHVTTKNFLRWATRILRPTISMHVSLWHTRRAKSDDFEEHEGTSSADYQLSLRLIDERSITIKEFQAARAYPINILDRLEALCEYEAKARAKIRGLEQDVDDVQKHSADVHLQLEGAYASAMISRDALNKMKLSAAKGIASLESAVADRSAEAKALLANKMELELALNKCTAERDCARARAKEVEDALVSLRKSMKRAFSYDPVDQGQKSDSDAPQRGEMKTSRKAQRQESDVVFVSSNKRRCPENGPSGNEGRRKPTKCTSPKSEDIWNHGWSLR